MAVPLKSEENMLVGWIMNKKAVLSMEAQRYVDELKKLIVEYGFEVLLSP